MNRHTNRPVVKDRRKMLRDNPTKAEKLLWRYLKNRQIQDKRFRRQFSIGPYIVDFFCPECRLIVELDGSAHFDMAGIEYDRRRREYLENLGMTIIRFENRQVYTNVGSVLERILEKVTSPAAHKTAQPPLLFDKEG